MFEGVAWGSLVGIGKALLDLATTTKKNKEEIKELRKELDEISTTLLKVTLELQHLKESQETRERNLILELENQLLQFQSKLPKQLPPEKE